ncbi:hypothetical protein ADK70_14980 [Streptomyces rimosus subsp. pseudoverticillatus]|uniref:hypothetical protein n=1 Tax=Streptomyces rimosus TaxID=1927 RepID=UPI0006C3AF75|nr:hypothetical protein [Streptomyces rimosus]KOT92806.1 hypothetical protein ADK70_14980 [Streptomyces rimosus subsp. pseudoverticillatus]
MRSSLNRLAVASAVAVAVSIGIPLGPLTTSASAVAAPHDQCAAGTSQAYNVVADYTCVYTYEHSTTGEPFMIQVDVGNNSIEQVRVQPVRIELRSGQQSLNPIQVQEDGVVLPRTGTRVFRVRSEVPWASQPFDPQVRLVLSVANPDGTHVGEIFSPWMDIEEQ